MPFQYITNTTAIINVLKNHNTTTATPDLSDGLSERVKNDNIVINDPELSQTRSDRFPAIYVMINTKDEEYEGIGATGVGGAKKRATLSYDIFAIFGKYGSHSSHTNLLTDVYKFAGNIEGVFQQEYTLSNTALWCNPTVTEFSPATDIGEGFVKAVLIRLEADYIFR